MASIGRCARRLPASKCLRPSPSAVTARCFSSPAAPVRPSAAAKSSKIFTPFKRNFSQVPLYRAAAAATNQTQEAPNAQAYLNSGAIAGARNLVDVKKVLVIGSGGLSIGQAGEFDYSGTDRPYSPQTTIFSHRCLQQLKAVHNKPALTLFVSQDPKH